MDSKIKCLLLAKSPNKLCNQILGGKMETHTTNSTYEAIQKIWSLSIHIILKIYCPKRRTVTVLLAEPAIHVQSSMACARWKFKKNWANLYLKLGVTGGEEEVDSCLLHGSGIVAERAVQEDVVCVLLPARSVVLVERAVQVCTN